ncbi:MAG: acyl-CoA desaturase, partial [Acidobacteriota bacterium]|nr:acyl-CoA desaturase [Acidobacteriota bacterium]
MNARQHYGFVLLTSVVPLLGALAAALLLWSDHVGPADVVAFAVMYLVSGLGVTVGYHRLLAHRAFQTHRPIRFALAAAGAMAGQAPPIIWVAHHRCHHANSDRPGDPHSPYGEDDPSLRGALRGLWHAHLGWLLDRRLTSEPLRWCPDLVREPDMRLISRYFVVFLALGIAIPAALGGLITGTLTGVLTGALWGGLVRLFIGNHVTYSVNSIGHYFGSRRFPTQDHSRNVPLLAVLSLGEGWHNNHHAFPRSASHGLRWYELDVSALFIALLARLHLAWDVVRIAPALQDSRAAGLTSARFHRAAASAPAADRSAAPAGAGGAASLPEHSPALPEQA